jgi:hypothetical protein
MKTYEEWSFELVVRKIGDNMPKNILKKREGISLLIPTLKRPLGMEKFATSVDSKTIYPNNIEIIFGIHEDDTESIEKAKELNSKCKISIRGELIDRYRDGKVHLAFLWNQIYNRSKYTILGYFGDDVIFHTPGWDDEVRKEFSIDKTIMVACNDVHVQKGKTATLFFTHKTVHEKAGFYLYMKLRRWYIDTYWDAVFRIAGKLHYREDIITEHLHPDIFPERLDNTYKNMENFKEPDKRLWETENLRQEIFKMVDMLKELEKNNNHIQSTQDMK